MHCPACVSVEDLIFMQEFSFFNHIQSRFVAMVTTNLCIVCSYLTVSYRVTLLLIVAMATVT